MSLDPNAPSLFTLKNSDLFEVYSEKNLFKTSFQTMVNALPPFLDLAVFPLVNVKAYGAIGNGIADDTVAIQNAINAASTLTANGGIVFLPDGNYLISSPLILPRGGVSATNIVQLNGVGFSTNIVGSSNFPENRALIEWQAVYTRCWQQRIENLRLTLPNVANTKAIHYKLTQNSVWNDYSVQRLQINLKNILISCHNDYHQNAIILEGGIWYRNIENIICDPGLGNNTYDTLLLQTDYDELENGNIDGHDTFIPDAPGFFMCNLNHLYSTWRRGGRGLLFKGRIYSTNITNSFCDGGSTNPCFWFINSYLSNLNNLSCEGREDKPSQYLFENCRLINVDNCGIGSPFNFKTGLFGNGVEVRNSKDINWNGRLTGFHNATYSVQGNGKKIIVIDENSKRCKFTNFYIKGTTVSDEIEINGDSSNSVQYVNFGTNPETTGTITGS